MHRIASLFVALTALFVPALAHADCTLGTPGTTQRIAVGDTGRSLLLHMPASASRAAPLPLVFALHGSTASGAAILRESGLEATADANGFLLAAPDAGIPAGQGYVWNIPGVPTVSGEVPGPSDPDDVAFLGAAIDWLVAQGCADSARVYATGFSGGGRMTSWLGCVASDRFAAIAPIAGLRAGNPLASDKSRPDPATCTPEHSLPVLSYSGTVDTTNPPGGGGAGYWQYDMATALARWATLNGCRVAPAHDVANETRYSECEGEAEVIGRMVPGKAHVWVADNDALWRFFAQHRR